MKTNGEAQPRKKGPAVPLATDEQVRTFVAAADRMGHPSIGTAALMCRALGVRPELATVLDARNCCPSHAPNKVWIQHPKTGVVQPTELKGASPLLAQLGARLKRAKAGRTVGPLLMRDHVRRDTGKIVSWSNGGIVQTFYSTVRSILIEAKLTSLSFAGFRQPMIANQEDDGSTDADMMTRDK